MRSKCWHGVEGQPSPHQPQPLPLPGSPVPEISSGQLNPPPSQEEVKNVSPQSGTLKFNGVDAYLMELNKASLKTSQTAPGGRAGCLGSPLCLPRLSVLESAGPLGILSSCVEPSAAHGLRGSCPLVINIRRMSEVPREQGRNSGCQAPFQEGPPSPWEACPVPLLPPLSSPSPAGAGRSAGHIPRRGTGTVPQRSLAYDGA